MRRMFRWLKDMWWACVYILQKARRGYSDYEVFELGSCVREWALPRLKAYRAGLDGNPASITYEEWEHILDEMIWAFQRVHDDENDGPYLTPGEYDRVQEGHELFGKWLQALWN